MLIMGGFMQMMNIYKEYYLKKLDFLSKIGYIINRKAKESRRRIE